MIEMEMCALGQCKSQNFG